MNDTVDQPQTLALATLPKRKAAIVRDVVTRMLDGQSKYEACDAAGVPPLVFHEIENLFPEAAAAVVAVEEITAERLVERLARVDVDTPNPQMAKVVSDNLKWLAAVRARGKFGTQTAERPQDSSLVDVLREAIDRIPRPADATHMRPVHDVIDAQPVEISGETDRSAPDNETD